MILHQDITLMILIPSLVGLKWYYNFYLYYNGSMKAYYVVGMWDVNIDRIIVGVSFHPLNNT